MRIASSEPAVVPFLDLGREVQALRPELDTAIARVLDRGRFVLGAEVDAFEQEFAAWLGVGHAVGVASGTDAIALALRALGVQAGDEVITVANTCAPTAFGISMTGASVRLADCDPDTLMLSLPSVEAAITRRTRAIVPVHLYGSAADMAALRALAEARGLWLVEDCSHAIGTLLHGGPAGTFGHAAAFSFYPTKNLGAYGDGGCVVTPRADVAERVRLLRRQGEKERDVASEFGLNSRLDEIQAAILRAKLGRVRSWNERRNQIARRYRDALAGFAIRIPNAPAYLERHAYHLFPVLVDDRDRFRRRLASRGIETLVHYPLPLHFQPALRHLGYRKRAFPNAERVCCTVVSLPLFPHLTGEEIEQVVRAVRESLG